MAWLLKRKDTGINYTDFELNQPEHLTDEDYGDFRAGRSLDLPFPHIHTATQIKQTSGRVPDILTIRTFHFCNQRFKDFVESWEPGLHFFKPVDLKRKDGERIGDYYIWTVGQDVDCILTDNLGAFWNEQYSGFSFPQARSKAEYEYEYPGEGSGTVIRISRSAVAGRHLWTAGLLAAGGRGYESYFMSDEMYKAYKKEKLRFMDLSFPVEEVDRPWIAEENMGIMLDKWRARETMIGECWPDAAKRHGGRT